MVAGRDSGVVAPPDGAIAGVVVVEVLVGAPVDGDMGLVVAGIFGVVVESGIFGGFSLGRVSPGVPALGDPGVTGVVTPGVAGTGVVVWATVVVTVAGLCLPLLSAAYPAAAAPRTSTAVTPRIVAADRALDRPRLPRAPAPHCRHQSWPSAIGAP